MFTEIVDSKSFEIQKHRERKECQKFNYKKLKMYGLPKKNKRVLGIINEKNYSPPGAHTYTRTQIYALYG